MRARGGTWLVLGALALGLLLSTWLARRAPDLTPFPRGEGVILFAPNLSETAWEIGYGDRILAITDYCIWPPELLERPRVGGMVDPNLERILALDPGLLVVQGESRILSEFALENGIRLERVDMDRGLESILIGYAHLDSVLGGGGGLRGQAMRERIESELDLLRESRPGGETPRTLLSLGHDPGALTHLWSMGEGSFLLDLLEIAGGRAPFDEMPEGYFELGLERLMADPPELVIELRPGQGLSEAARAELVAVWRAQGVSCPVEFVDFEGSLIPGPRIVQSVRALRAAMDRALAESAP